MLRTAWIPYYYSKHIQQIEAIGIERDLAGLPHIEMPEGADVADTTTSDLGKARQIVRNVRNDEQAGIVTPFGWKFQLVSTGGSRQFDTDKIIRRYESRILMSVLAQFLQLGQDGVGSLALSKDQTDLFNMSVNSVADIIGETFTKYAIPRILKLNGYNHEGVRLEHTIAGDVDVTMLADILQKTSGMVTWDAEDEVWWRQTIGMPERSVDELEAEREEEDNQRREVASQIGKRAQEVQTDEEIPEEDTDEMSAFAPDKSKRRRYEGTLRKRIAEVLTSQRKKVMKSVKGLLRG